MVWATQSTHKLLAGISQASQVLVQDAQERKLDRHLFNEAYLMHTSTSPQYAIIASCDVAAAMMEPPGGTGAGGGEHPRIAGLPPRHAQGREGVRPRLVVQGLGPGQAGRRGHRQEQRLGAQGQRQVARLRRAGRRLQPARPDQVHDRHAGAGPVGQDSPRPASRRRIVTKFLAEHGVVVEKTGLYSFFIMFTIGITKGRWNTLLTALQQFKDDYDKNAPLWRILPEFCAAHPRYERMGLRDLCQAIHEYLCPERHRAADDRDVPVGPAPGDEAQRGLSPTSRTARPSGCPSTSWKGASRRRC
jgi:arginine decarboxylase